MLDPLKEMQHRRSGWTPGAPVALADDHIWRFPQIDLVLMLKHLNLQNELRRAINVSENLSTQLDDATFNAIGSILFQAQLANLAVHLLQVNYELINEDWCSLLSFKADDGMKKLTDRLSVELGKTVSAWMPFVLMGGSEVMLPLN